MNGTTRGVVCALAFAGGIWQGACAYAAVIGGNVSTSSAAGVFELLDPAPAAAGPDAFQSPNLVAFDEQQDVLVTERIVLRPGLVIGVGSVISSHYVAFDPLDPATITGAVTFDAPIVAVVSRGMGLDTTSPLFGLAATAYTTGPAIGPDEATDMVRRAPGIPNRLLFEAAAAAPGDQVRVLTGTLAPEPAGLVLALLGAPITLLARRRR